MQTTLPGSEIRIMEALRLEKASKITNPNPNMSALNSSLSHIPHHLHGSPSRTAAPSWVQTIALGNAATQLKSVMSNRWPKNNNKKGTALVLLGKED